MAQSQQISYRAFTVVKREGTDDFWLPIGAAFEHQDGEGYNLVLQALPLDGRVVLRTPKDDEKAENDNSRGLRNNDKPGLRRR